jgi:hypothetical protein
MGWMRLTAGQAAVLFRWCQHLAQPAREMPPIVPGDIDRLAENPRDPEAIGRLRRRFS